MGILQSLARVFGFTPPLEVREPAPPFALTPSAVAHLAAVGRGVRATTAPAAGGWVVRAEEVDGSGLIVAPADAERLRGLTLDWDGVRWATRLALRVDAMDTPNPDGRAYLADRVLALGRPRFFTQVDGDTPALARRVLAIPDVRTALFRDNVVVVERTPGADWNRLDGAVDAALREHLLLCGGPIDGVEPPARVGLLADVQRVIDAEIAPRIHADGGDIELVDVRDGIAVVSLIGACRTCPASQLTLKAGVQRTLKERFPGVIDKVEAM
jgi:Fe-S cluster biogenesis protein NfuA